jgi:hypothetical protein
VAGAAASLTSVALPKLRNRGPDGFLSLIGSGDYLALLAYMAPDPEVEELVSEFRLAVRQRTRAATMFGYGPRYLHSTGQLHKGGAANGVFVVITATPHEDVAIPGEPFSFGTLALAQAMGDLQSLHLAGRRALHLHLPAPDHAALKAVLDTLLEGL